MLKFIYYIFAIVQIIVMYIHKSVYNIYDAAHVILVLNR